MDPGMVGGIAGGVVGVMGGLIGTYFGVRNTTRPRERRLAIRLAAALWVWIAFACGWVLLGPRPWNQLGLLATLPTLFIPRMNRMLERARAADMAEKSDERDTIIALHDAPRPDVGAPLPHLICDEHHVLLAYLINEPDPAWDGSYVNIVGPSSEGYSVAVVRFERPNAQMFGPPNDEAFHGHPLAARGLHPYAVFEVKDSSWLERLERMNSVHPRHDRERFLANRRHFIFAFHDTTFECIAQEFTFELIRGSLSSVLPRLLAELLGGEA